MTAVRFQLLKVKSRFHQAIILLRDLEFLHQYELLQ
jgi:hypothetical protein